MLKTRLLLGVAFAVLGLTMLPVNQAAASETDLDIFADWDSDIETSLEWNVDVDKFIDIDGDIFITGTVDADALAMATLQDEQILAGNTIRFEDHQNANMAANTEFEPDVDAGNVNAWPATYTNTVTSGDGTAADATGNIGINLVAGDFNLQENAAVLASAEPSISVEDGVSGGAEAGSFSLQNLYQNYFNTSADTAEQAGMYEVENLEMTNSVSVGSGTLSGASGNIGLNGAAGVFNIQKNALVIASVDGGNLAEATAGVIQDAQDNHSAHEITNNTVAAGALAVGATGNIGVNLASGVGNLQLNSLTISSALAANGVAPPDNTGTGSGSGSDTGTGAG